ncbi:uncharacterized protein LOC127751585 [Frankliniella occidentalis]|uniref:Uncharacterized protein LOC127751585 n=1 Tax=Frankliniella occidentalis TaxID=133901 RepID=A0A9C6X938_FRAOC|nr:uncharacterized protein LOC127751585 [Frankliniella occidentalis]
MQHGEGPRLVAPLLAVLVLSSARRSHDKTHLEVRPTFIRPCKINNNAVKAADAVFAMRGRTTVVFHLNVTVSRSVARWSKSTAVIEQCDQTVSAATCSTFRTFEFHDICAVMMSAAMPWARVLASIRPKMSCPVTKGKYTLSNGSLAMDLLNAVSGPLRLEGFVWRALSQAVDSRGDPHICLDSAGEFFRVRNRPKVKGIDGLASDKA